MKHTDQINWKTLSSFAITIKPYMVKLHFNWTGCVTVVMVWRSFLLFSIWTPTAPWGMRRSPMSTGIFLFPHFLCLAQGSARNSCAVGQPSWISLWTRGDRSGCSGGMEPSTSVTSLRPRRLWLPALPRCCRYQWMYRTVHLKDRSMSRLSLGEIAAEAPWSTIFSILTWTGHPKYEADSDARPESIMFLTVHKLTGLVRFSGIY